MRPVATTSRLAAQRRRCEVQQREPLLAACDAALAALEWHIELGATVEGEGFGVVRTDPGEGTVDGLGLGLWGPKAARLRGVHLGIAEVVGIPPAITMRTRSGAMPKVPPCTSVRRWICASVFPAISTHDQKSRGSCG